MSRRAWTLEGARALLPDVRSRTARAVEEADALLALVGEADAAARQALDARVQRCISRWAREMEALGVDVPGPWRVEFDNGDGCYCWSWPEEGVEFARGASGGHAGRGRIQ